MDVYSIQMPGLVGTVLRGSGIQWGRPVVSQHGGELDRPRKEEELQPEMDALVCR